MSPKRTKSTPQPRLIVVSAPSGAGKTTLCEMLLKEFPQIVQSTSATTRAKRAYETDGVHYHFLSKEAFAKKLAANEFVESAEVHGNRYGTLKVTVEKLLNEGKHVLFVIDVQGAMSLLKLYQERVLLLFVRPPSVEELTKRLQGRAEDSLRSIQKRISNAEGEMQFSENFDYQILNDDLNKAFAQMKEIVEKECL